MKQLSLFILSVLIIWEGKTQPMLEYNVHDSLETLENCIRYLPSTKEHNYFSPFSFKELLSLIQSDQSQSDSLLHLKHFKLQKIKFEKDSLNKSTTAITYSYLYDRNTNKHLELRKICTKYDSLTGNCRPKNNIVWSTPLTIQSTVIDEISAYKLDFLLNFKERKLIKCETSKAFRGRYFSVHEIYETPNYEIMFQAYCQKVKEKATGFFCEKCSSFTIQISYSEAYLNRILNSTE
ncbi:hypothetical protein [Aureispira anguillae]|uniref:Uncharacterized protein n=1 Tax=Aureispira anguillae TaxID=2864201 RepID=A0A916DUW8_9BACT|nr:hypothetical protein [Aureispira anguillae]BDS13107.1 hypothetical protein AsAng_0038350 [Aureispira anguillae]